MSKLVMMDDFLASFRKLALPTESPDGRSSPSIKALPLLL
jgi:hypothetical protein